MLDEKIVWFFAIGFSRQVELISLQHHTLRFSLDELFIQINRRVWQLIERSLYSDCIEINGLRLDHTESRTASSELSATSFHFAIVASRWNDEIVSRLIDGAQDALWEFGAGEKSLTLFRVPGSFELALCAMKAAQSKKFDAVICLGVIIRGETPHFEFVAAETARGINEAGLRTGVPVMFGVITANTVEQALERAGKKHENKGYEAALAAVEVVNLYQNLK